tara:strand:+ start:419 stop:703 length:285 start_codon:yes stop_codon:yes gene_type:complete
MIDTITENQFVDEMIKHNEFTVEGSKVLFEHLEEIDPNGEFDPVGIRCEYHEYENFEEIQEQYRNLNIKSISELKDYTTVIEIPDSDRLIIRQF